MTTRGFTAKEFTYNTELPPVGTDPTDPIHGVVGTPIYDPQLKKHTLSELTMDFMRTVDYASPTKTIITDTLANPGTDRILKQNWCLTTVAPTQNGDEWTLHDDAGTPRAKIKFPAGTPVELISEQEDYKHPSDDDFDMRDPAFGGLHRLVATGVNGMLSTEIELL